MGCKKALETNSGSSLNGRLLPLIFKGEHFYSSIQYTLYCFLQIKPCADRIICAITAEPIKDAADSYPLSRQPAD